MNWVGKAVVLVAALAVVLGVLSAGEVFSDVRFGTLGSDSIEGTERSNLLVGLGGHDEIFGYGKWDLIFGGSGSDQLYGGPGVDILQGGDGDDQLYVWDDRDRDLVISCGSGYDTVYISYPEQALGSIDKQTCEVVQNVPFDDEASETW